MTRWSLPHPVLPHCQPQDDFLRDVSSFLVTCIPTYAGLFSTLFGNLSILAWLCAQLPQVFKNYRLKSTAGLSVYFLIEWLLGDTTNLVGAILTHQATWQVVLASYYTTIDIVLVGQFIYYMRLKPWRERGSALRDQDADGSEPDPATASGSLQRPLDEQGEPSQDRHSAHRGETSKPQDIPSRPAKLPGSSSSPTREKITSGSSRPLTRSNYQRSGLMGISPQAILAVSMLCTLASHASPLPSELAPVAPEESDRFDKEAFGRTVSWLSAFLYLGSRLPQIYKNHVRRSTAGLSPVLFAAAFVGNFFYSASLLTNPLAWNDYPPFGHFGWAPAEGSNRVEWVTTAVPFFLGAGGVLLLDMTIGIQFLMFGEGREEPKVAVVEDSRGRGHWRKVSGWMRGWVPSPAPGQTFDQRLDRASDDERPLLQRGSSYDSSRQYGVT